MMSPVRELIQLELAKRLADSRSTDLPTMDARDMGRFEALVQRIEELEQDEGPTLDLAPKERARFERIVSKVRKTAPLDVPDVRGQLADMLRVEIGKRLETARQSEAPTLTAMDLVTLEALASRLRDVRSVESYDLSRLSIAELRFVQNVGHRCTKR